MLDMDRVRHWLLRSDFAVAHYAILLMLGFGLSHQRRYMLVLRLGGKPALDRAVEILNRA